MLTIRLQKKVTHNNIGKLFDESEQIFELNGTNAVVVINATRVDDLDLISQLTLYKIVSYIVKNNTNFDIKFYSNNYVLDKLKDSGFYDLLSRFAKDSKEKEKKEKHHENNPLLEKLRRLFKESKIEKKEDLLTQVTDLSSLDSHFGDKFYIAPFTLVRTETHKRDKQAEIKRKIKLFYADDVRKVRTIYTCIEEIYMNFWRHATDDSETVMLVHGTKKYVEIMVADNGQGIRTTLSGADYNPKTNLVAKAVQRGVTSKPHTCHMGWGLWLVSEVARNNGGTFRLFSEGDYFSISRGDEQSGKCGFWKGTVIYLNLPLINELIGLEKFDLPEMKKVPLIRWEN